MNNPTIQSKNQSLAERAAQKRDLRRIYWSAFIIRFVLGCVVWLIAKNSFVTLLEDAQFYEEAGANVAQDWLAGRESLYLSNAIETGRQGWLMVAGVATVYFLLGGIRAVPLLIAVFAAASAVAPGLTYRIVQELGGSRRAANFGAALITFSPCFVFWAGALYKEGIILLVLNLAILHTLYLLKSWRFRSVLVVAGSLGVLGGLRFYLVALLGAAILFCLPFGKPKSDMVGAQVLSFVRQMVAIAAVSVLAFSLGVADRLAKSMPQNTTEILDQLGRTRTDLATRGRSGFLLDADISTPQKALAFIPIGSVYFLALPLPWHIGSVRQNMAIPETAFWILLYPLVLWGMFIAARRNWRGTILLGGFCLLMTALYGMYAANIGTSYRMRTQVWLFFAAFAGIGWEHFRTRMRARQPRAAGDHGRLPLTR